LGSQYEKDSNVGLFVLLNEKAGSFEPAFSSLVQLRPCLYRTPHHPWWTRRELNPKHIGGKPIKLHPPGPLPTLFKDFVFEKLATSIMQVYLAVKK